MTVLGVGGHPVTVEAFVGRGLPVAHPDRAARRGGARMPAIGSGPRSSTRASSGRLRRVVVNLAPGNLRKEGAGLDLPIAVERAGGHRPGPGRRPSPAPCSSGELSLKGEVLPTPGVLSVAIAAVRAAATASSSCPTANAVEAAQVDGIARGRRGVRSSEVVGFLRGTWHAARGRGRRGRRVGSRRPPTSPTCAGKRRRAGRSRSPPPAGTTCCSSARPAPARRCSPGGSHRSCPSSPATKRSRPRSCIRWRGCWPGRGLLRRASLPRAAPFDHAPRGCSAGGSTVLAAGRGEPRAPRRPVPGRADRVPPRRDRGAPPAARGRPRRRDARRRAR